MNRGGLKTWNSSCPFKKVASTGLTEPERFLLVFGNTILVKIIFAIFALQSSYVFVITKK